MKMLCRNVQCCFRNGNDSFPINSNIWQHIWWQYTTRQTVQTAVRFHSTCTIYEGTDICHCVRRWHASMPWQHGEAIMSEFLHEMERCFKSMTPGSQMHLLLCTVVASAWTFRSWPIPQNRYRQVSNIRRTLVGNKIVDHSGVVGASPVGAAPTTSSLST